MDKYVIDDILNAVVDEKPVDLQAALNSIMVDKAHEYIANMKSQLMNDVLADRSGEDDWEDEAETTEDETDAAEEDAEVEADETDEPETDEVEELDAEELFNDLDTTEDETENQG